MYKRQVHDAWLLLARSVYGAGAKIVEQGCHESVLCARPALDVYQVSSWSEMEEFYNPDDVINAARLMVEASREVKANANFCYDLVDVTRQAIAEQARYVYDEIVAAYKAKDRKMFDYTTKRFLDILLQQDRLLSSMPDFMVGRWLRSARNLGLNEQERNHYEWNARVQITTWGNRSAAEYGGLREYAHKEWNGVLADFYYPRWKAYFEALAATLDGKPMKQLDFYAMDEKWTLLHNVYPYEAQGNPVEFAQTVFENVFGK